MGEQTSEILRCAGTLDEAICNAIAFRCLIESLHDRRLFSISRIDLPGVEFVRASALRSLINTVTMALDDCDRGAGASLGRIVEMMRDQDLLSHLVAIGSPGRKSEPNPEAIRTLPDQFATVVGSAAHDRIRALRDPSVVHCLRLDSAVEPVDYGDINRLLDETGELVVALYQGLGEGTPIFVELRPKIAQSAARFWDTYFRGLAST